MNIILASGSPRRQELLKYAVSDFLTVPADIDETLPAEICADDSAEYLATQKALAVSQSHKDDIVIGCDTVVILDNQIFGKPENDEDARRMLKSLSGRVHKVVTGICICKGKASLSFSVTTEVEFYELSDDEIDAYILTKEPADKAGAYGIQGKGCMLVKEIKGDFFNVVGLPVSRLKRELDKIL